MYKIQSWGIIDAFFKKKKILTVTRAFIPIFVADKVRDS